MNLYTALRKELMEQWRTSRLIILAVVLLVFGLTSPLLAKYMPELLKLIPGADQFAALVPKPTIVDAVAQYVIWRPNWPQRHSPFRHRNIRGPCLSSASRCRFVRSRTCSNAFRT